MWKNFRFISRRLATTVDQSEIQHFKKYTEEWWNETGLFKPLHALNKLRIPLIRDGIINTRGEKSHTKPLKGVFILDVGCGGGILSEPLAKIGANVTGIDPNGDIIEKAKLHKEKKNLSIEYFASSIEKHSCDNKQKYDGIVASEIVEHVTQKKEFLTDCVLCLKPGGSIFITTMNKNFIANFVGIGIAENLLGLLPKGTHQYEKFIQPHHLEKILEDLGCKTVSVQGMSYNFVKNEWSWCSNNTINYALHAVKLKQEV